MAYQQYESFQTTLPPTVSAGWNDPPPMATSAPSTGAASRLTQMRRRPVDPSITGPSYGGHAPYGGQQTGYGAPMQQQQQAPQGYPGYPAQQAPAYGAPQQQQPQMQAYPGGQPSPAYPTSQPSYQQNQPMAAPITMQPGMQQGYGMNPYQPWWDLRTQAPYWMYFPPPPAVSAAYAPQVSPVVSQQGAALAQQGQAQFNPAANNAAAAYYPADPTGGAPQQTASMPSSQHRAIYDAFTVNNVPPAGVKTDPFLVRPQSSAPSVPIHTAATHAAWTGSSMSPSQSPYAATTTPVMTQPLEANPQSLIFAPPNAVGEAQPGQVPADPSMYNRVPVKAAGDVSLTGPQCVMFLMKATTRLPQAKCEGVQLRLNQLQELIQQGRLSEQCLKKLNFVVDAIDRGMLDDATAYFDQLQAQFPHELGAWGQGVRLLIGELRGPAGRVGSAGAHVRSQ